MDKTAKVGNLAILIFGRWFFFLNLSHFIVWEDTVVKEDTMFVLLYR